MLVKMRALKNRVSPLGQVLHVMARSQLVRSLKLYYTEANLPNQVINCFVSSTPPPLGVGWWMQMGTKDGIPYQCARLNLETATLHAKANDTLAEAVDNPTDIDKIIEIERMTQDLELKFEDWENSLQPPWSFSSVAWIDHTEVDQLEYSPSFPGRVDEYTDISIAAAWNVMRANRIMLGAGIVRASAWLHPQQDYRITPEFASTAKTSKDLIEDIIASVPRFLGTLPETKRKNGSLSAEKEGLNGKGALALFILWPLFIVSISDHTTDEQRKWASGRVRFVAEEVGIQQASLFNQVCSNNPKRRSTMSLMRTKLNIRLPSMFIYKDRVAKEEGNAIARIKCIELAIAKSKGVGKEAEQVLAGVLGCK
jgi:hypothetical protein